MAHGIGQGREESIQQCAGLVRGLSERMHRSGKFAAAYRDGDHRIEFLPVQWRTSLTLDEGALQEITLDGIKNLRDIANDQIMDVLYWTSPR